MRIHRLIPALALLSILASCQKELGFVEGAENNGNNGNNPGSNIDVIGNWKFAGTTAVNSTTASFTEDGEINRIESVLEYGSTDPGGTLTFTSNQMTTRGITFNIEGVMRTKYTIGGVVVMEQEDDVNAFTPPSDGQTSYVRNSPDSLTADQPPFEFPTSPGTGVPVTNAKIGMKLRMSNDTLYTRIRMVTSVTVPDPDVPTTMTINVNAEYAWVK